MKFVRAVPFLLAAVITLNPVAAIAQTQGPIYIVEEGDTLFAIALVFGTSVDQLASANAIEDPSNIFPGQELVIPGLEGMTGILQFENLAFGESLSSLSIKHGTSPDLLARLNRIVHADSLIAGQSFAYSDDSLIGTPMPSAERVSVSPAVSLLETAISLGTDPWATRRLNRTAWAIPGDMLYAPGDRLSTSALPPDFESVAIGPLPTIQGRTIVIAIQTANPDGVSGMLGESELALIESSPGVLTALHGVHALAEPGLLNLELRASSGASHSQAIQLAEGNYGLEALIVPEQTLDPASTGPEDQLIAEVVNRVSSTKLWDGVFSFPTGYYEAFPSFFGTRRSYNGSAFIYYHTGLDLYGSTTTPVLAPARGRVAFTDFLTVRGNVTYIDHGWGVYTGYLHQSEVLVELGELVEPGQTIGFVGGTGRVTGPHLHWEVWVGGIPVDPLEWTRTVFP